MRKVFVLVGAPASGKSTWAKNYINTRPNTLILSSDALRKEYYGDENIQDNPSLIFKVLRERLEKLLKYDYNVIIDATNMNRKDRRAYISIAKKHKAEINAIVFATPYGTCLRRNAMRERKVPEAAIKRMISRFEIPTRGEGFNTVLIKSVNNFEFETDEKETSFVFDNFGDQKNHHHSLGLKEHCNKCERLVREMGGNYSTRNAARFHDLGKIYTQTFDENGEAHYYQHANWGAYQALAFHWSDYSAVILINYHMMMYQDAAREKIKKIVGEELYKELTILHMSDEGAH